MISFVFRNLLLLFPVFACLLLCSCTTAMTWSSLGRETFTWNPEELQVSVRTELDKRFLEHKTIRIVKKGTLRKYFMPYDFSGSLYTEKQITRTIDVPVRGNLPIFTVKIDPKAKPVMIRHKKQQISTDSDLLDYSYVGFAESAHPYSITPEDFALLQKPFWFRRNALDSSYCIPLTPLNVGSAYHIPVVMVKPGGEDYLLPDDLRVEKKHWRGLGITCARVLCCIIPLALDIATSPVQLIVFSLI